MLSKAQSNPEPPLTPSLRVMQSVRSNILSGAYSAGDRLPTNRALTEEHQVSLLTIQRAMNLLQSDGFIETRGRAGTFVTEAPPHLSQFELLMPQPMSTAGYESIFHDTLARVAGAHMMPQGKALQITQIRLDWSDADDAHRQLLVQRLERHALAGLIMPFHPHSLIGTAMLADDGVPRVAVMPDHYWSHIDSVYLDYPCLYRKAMQYLSEQPRKRVALISSSLNEQTIAQVRATAEANGLLLPDDLCMSFAVHEAVWAERYMSVLMKLPATERPDAVFVADDHMTDIVVRGLVRAGVHIGEDVDVVSHANFPLVRTDIAHVHRIGFDMPTLLQLCVNSLIRQQESGRTGFEPGPVPLVPAITQP